MRGDPTRLLQETPDSPEALKCIPGLALSDIPKEASSIPTDIATEQVLANLCRMLTYRGHPPLLTLPAHSSHGQHPIIARLCFCVLVHRVCARSRSSTLWYVRACMAVRAESSLGCGSQAVQLLRHDLFTNDVLYLELALDLRPLPPHLLPLLPLFCR